MSKQVRQAIGTATFARRLRDKYSFELKKLINQPEVKIKEEELIKLLDDCIMHTLLDKVELEERDKQ